MEEMNDFFPVIVQQLHDRDNKAMKKNRKEKRGTYSTEAGEVVRGLIFKLKESLAALDLNNLTP